VREFCHEGIESQVVERVGHTGCLQRAHLPFLALPQPALARYGLPEVRVTDGQVRHNKAGASTIRTKIASELAAGWLRLWQLTGTTHAIERVQPAVSRG